MNCLTTDLPDNIRYNVKHNFKTDIYNISWSSVDPLLHFWETEVQTSK